MPFYSLKTQKKKKFWKKENNCWRYHHFTHVCQKPQSYKVWFLRYGVRHTEFFLSFWAIFCPSTLLPPIPSPYNPENQNFKKPNEVSGDVIILQKCTINADHIMYGSWDIRHSGQSFLSFRVIFCLLTNLKIEKNQNFEKRNKKPGYIIILHLCTTNDNYMMYGSCDIEQDIIFCHFGLFFALLTPNKLENQNY